MGACLGSVALHLLALVVVSPPTPEKQISPHHSQSVVHARLIPAQDIATAGDTASMPPVPNPAPDTATPPSAPVTPLPPPAAVPPPEPPPTEDPSAAPASPSLPGYLPIEAVDQPATPLGDWDINPDELPRDTTLRLQIQLWISAQGSIDQWDLLDGSQADTVLVYKALSNLQHTRLQPALLNHVAVPSVRRVELVISRE